MVVMNVGSPTRSQPSVYIIDLIQGRYPAVFLPNWAENKSFFSLLLLHPGRMMCMRSGQWAVSVMM